ncbi:hypothetical protein [Candidatus Thiodictyon syntrophicum]|jgi:hypothetical protein|nr:hypothetical protein [Candidatus Thiodictyon syntrophicum]
MRRLFLVAAFLASTSASAQTHCLPGETDLLSGLVGSTEGGFSGDKILSLCADRSSPPFGQISYRFGRQGAVELEYTAPRDGFFFADEQSPSPRSTIYSLYFRKGGITYAVTECMGMLCGIRDVKLMVFDGKRTIASLDSEPDRFEVNTSIDKIKGRIVKTRTSGLNYDEN